MATAVAVVIGHLLMVPGSQLARVLNLRLLTFIGVVSAAVQLVEMVLDRSFPALFATFGVFLSLLAVHCAILGGSLEDNLQTALTNQVHHLLQAGVFNAVGDVAEGKWIGIDWADGSAEKVALHAVVGGLLSEATGGDFATGALAAGANEALIEQLFGVIKGDRNLELAVSQLIGIGPQQSRTAITPRQPNWRRMPRRITGSCIRANGRWRSGWLN